MRLLFFILFIWLSLSAQAQLNPEKAAFNRIQKGKWSKAKKALEKALDKSPVNPEAHLVYAFWYFTPPNPAFDIDSAYRHTQRALQDYRSLPIKERERLARVPLDSSRLLLVRSEIDSAAFERAKTLNTEEGYIYFIENFQTAVHIPEAIELRDEVAFLTALKTNTYQSFQTFMQKYPASHRYAEAKARYDKLLYETKTSDGKLASFRKFHQDYPESPYLEKAEQQILELSTTTSEPNTLVGFMNQYPHSRWSNRALGILFHLLRQSDEPFPSSLTTDSLRKVINMNAKYWMVFMKGSSFGFMDEDGTEVMPARFSHVAPDYLCGGIEDDFLLVDESIISRTGKVIAKGSIRSVEDIGLGFLYVKYDTHADVVHKSGWVFAGEVTDAHTVANRFLAIKKNKWALFSLAGRQLVDYRYDSIEVAEEILLLSRSGKKSLYNWMDLAGIPLGKSLTEKLVFDDSRKMGEGLLWVKNGALEGVLNNQLEYVVPLERQLLTKTSYGFMRQINRYFKPVGVAPDIDEQEYLNIRPYLRWVALHQPANKQLFDKEKKRIVLQSIDSTWFTNKVALAMRRDSLHVFMSNGTSLVFHRNNQVTFMKPADTLQYFYAAEKDKKAVFEVTSGNKMFVTEAEAVEYLGFGMFLVQQKNGKWGVVDTDGKRVLPVEYDAIVKTDEAFASLLKDRRFGLFDLMNQRLIKPSYERNIRQYNKEWLIAFKEGSYGLIDWTDKPVTEARFEEVRYWTDSLAMVKQKIHWGLFNLATGQIVQDRIKDYRLLRDEGDDKLAVIHVENDYGVLSSRDGLIIPPTFSDIVNVGTYDKPFYFTEKHVEEAELYVVIYYNQKGEFVKRFVYEDADYDRIYCTEN
ncbi:MAG: WG repeat-containing protein [Cyclobacteriaceae bacterium]